MKASVLDGLAHDFLGALRAIRNAPAFACVVVLTLAIGVASTTATFGVVHGVLLRPLPVADQGSVAVLSMHDRQNLSAHLPIQYRSYLDLRASSRTFANLAIVHMIGATTWNVRDGERALPLNGALVSATLFDVLDVTPVLGRRLVAADDEPGAPNVVVIGESVWRSDFAGDPAILGRPVRIFNRPYVIVGVMPLGLDFPRRAQAWAPVVGFDPGLRQDGTSGMFDVVARLRPGATLNQGRAELEAIIHRQPSTGTWVPTITGRSLAEVIVGDMRSRLLFLSIAVMLVLAIACGNVAILALARGRERIREMALRGALGASAWRIARQILVEQGVLAVLSCIFGVLAAAVMLRLLIALAPADLPRLDEIRFEPVTVLVAMLAAGLAVLFSSLVPAVVAINSDAAGILNAGGRAVASGWRRAWGQRLLIAVQVALACLVVVGATLLIRSLARLESLNLGFEDHHMVVARISSKEPTAPSLATYLTRFEVLRRDLVRLPGVVDVVPLNTAPFSGSAGLDRAVARAATTDRDGPVVNVEVVSERFFDLFAVPLKHGRAFSETDDDTAPQVAVVNEALARLLWRGDSPLGDIIRLELTTPAPRQVVGIVGDTRYRELTSVRPTLYLPLRQSTGGAAYIAVRTAANPRPLLPSIRRAVDELSPFRVGRIGTMDDLVAEPLTRPRFGAVLLALFAIAALMLVAVGIYSLLALVVRQRTHELGVRFAVGATRLNVQRLVLGEGLRIAVVGVAFGMAIALASTHTLDPLLFDVDSNDPLTLVAAALFVIAIVGAACAIPAWRASRVNPITVLRSE